VRYLFDRQIGLVIVSAELFGSSGSIILRLALDTGATATTVNAALLNTIGYDPSLVPDRIQLTTGSAVEYAPRLSIDRIDALGQVRTNFPVVAHTLPPTASVDGLLGLDFFRDQELILDFRKGVVVLS
jgi:predicted aspartyl protease